LGLRVDALPSRCPLRAKRSSLGWGCSRIGFFDFLVVVLVAQPPSCQGNQHNRERAKAAQERQEAVVVKDGSGKELTHRNGSPIKGRVNQDGHKHAAFGVVEDPRVHDGQAGGRKDKHHDVECSEFVPRRGWLRGVTGLRAKLLDEAWFFGVGEGIVSGR
jgi:hypothetical protein